MKTIFALTVAGLLACGPEKDDTGESPEADSDTDSDADTDTDADADSDADADADSDADADADADGDADTDTGCPDDSPVPEDWPEWASDADVHLLGWSSQSAAGDLDGDGRDDIVVNGDTLVLGPVCTGDDEDDVYAWLEGYYGDTYEWRQLRTQSAGDVDGSGTGDLVVGDYRAESTGRYAGEVFLLLTPLSRDTFLEDDAVATIVGDSAGQGLGYVLSGAGDVDGDSVPDLLVLSNGDGGYGAVWLLPGTTRGYHTASEVGVAIWGSEDRPTVGHSLAPVGDTDGDGLDDFLIGTDYYPVLPEVGLFRGPIVGDMAFEDADALFGSPVDGAWVGLSICGTGDQDGDGLPDLAAAGVGTEENPGGLYLFTGTALGRVSKDSARSVLLGEVQGGGVHAVNDAGDVNGDGQHDLVIGYSGYDAIADFAGAAYIVFGAVEEGTRVLGEGDVRILGASAKCSVGTDVAGAGDTNGDGLDDIMIGGWALVGTDWYHVSLLLGRR
ncbi:MAG: integrin alpha [Pseudomonadota bacterium]